MRLMTADGTLAPYLVDDDRSSARSIDLIEPKQKSQKHRQAKRPRQHCGISQITKVADTGSLFFRFRAQIASNMSDWDNG
jgi:hypothetical protein